MAKKLISFDDTKPGTGLPEVVEAKIGRREETDLTRELVSATARNAEKRRPLISIIDDDGNAALLNVLRPIAEARGIPIGAAVYTSNSPVVTNPALRAELLDLQDNHGWEIMSHTHAHINLGEVTPDEYEADCKAFNAVARRHGFKVENIVLPWGQESPNNYHVTARNFMGGFSTNTGINLLESTDPYSVRRVGLGSMMQAGVDTLTAFQGLIDDTKASNGWLVFMTHIGAADAAGVQLVKDVLDYAVAQGVDFVAPRDGLREFGALVQSGRRGATTGHFSVRPHGFIDSSRYFLTEKLGTNGKQESDPPTPGTLHRSQHWAASGWSIGNGYVTEWGLSSGWSVQQFRANNGRVFTREWGGDSIGWRVWQEMTRSFSTTKTATARTIAPHSTVNIDLYDSAFLGTMTFTASPVTAPPAGVIWQIWSRGSGAVTLRLANVTAAEITVPEGAWRVRAISA